MVAFKVPGQQYQMKASFLTWCAGRSISAATATDVCLAADDWLNTLAFHGVVERDGAEHIAMIGHCTGGHSQFGDAFRQRLDLNGAIQKAVVGMQM